MRVQAPRPSAPVAPLELISPGFRGLNTELTSVAGDVPGQWALALREAVFDESGTISTRQGWQNVTTVAMTGSVEVLRSFEYIQDDGTKILIGQSDAKLWKSTNDGSTWTDITGSLTWTTTRRWQFVNFNGFVIGCVKGQFPAVWNGSGNFTQIVATSGVLPVSDGTVLAAFGRVWFGEDSTGAVVYGGLLSYTLYATADGGGSLDTANVWTNGTDERMAMKAYGATFCIFGRRHIIMYVDGSGSTLGIDPNNMYVVDTIEGTGCVARDTVVNIGEGDLWYLSPTGVQSLSRVIQDKANPLVEITKWCSSLLRTLAANEPNLRYDVQATYNPNERFVLFLFPSSDTIIMLDTRYLQQDGTARVAEWQSQTHTCLLTRSDGTLLFGRTDGKLAQYTGYYDGVVGTYITLVYASPWLNFTARGQLKIPKRVTWSIVGRETLSMNTRWGFDFRGLEFTNTQTNDYVASGSEFGLAEFGADEWTDGTRSRRGYTPLSGNGGNMQIYFALVNTDVAARVAIKDLIIYTRLGRAI
jgi:hypothetical protein